MARRVFRFRLNSHPEGDQPPATTLRLERQDETGAWEELQPSLATPGFRLYLSSMLICLHYHLVSEAREQGLALREVRGDFSATTAEDWTLEEVSAEFRLVLDPGTSPSEDATALGEAGLIERMRARLLGCPVLRNLEASCRRSLSLQLER